MNDYIIVSPDPDGTPRVYYLREMKAGYVSWFSEQSMATRYLTYGHAMAVAQKHLPKHRNYRIIAIPSLPKGA